MWFKTIFRRSRPAAAAAPAPAADGPLFDEAFLRRLERLSLQAQRTLRGNPASGEHPSRQRLPATIFSDHRQYTSGDDLRHVDWNAYARQEHLLLRLGDAEQDVGVHLLLDTSRSMALGSPPRLRLARQLAGALGYLALAHSDRLLVAPFGGEPPRPFGPTQGKARAVELLRYLAELAPQPQAQLGATLAAHARRHPRGGLLVLISDLLAPGDLAEQLRPLAPPRWQVLVLHLLSAEDLAPTVRGPVELEDSETGARLELSLDAETLAAYRAALATWRDGLARACAARGAHYAPLLSDWPLERMVVPYLRARRMLA